MKSYMPIALALMLSFPCHAQEGAPKGLEAYADKDLRKSGDKKKQELYKQFQALTGDKPDKNASPQFEAWWIRQFRASNAAWMFLEAYPGYEVPDASGVQIHVFDKNWKRLVKQSFPTGYRFFLNEAKLLKNDTLDQDLLVTKTTSTGPFVVIGEENKPVFEQGDYQRQYYALLGDQFVLVRLEDHEGKLVRNHYRWGTPPKGPPVPKRRASQWIGSLSSTNPVAQLAALVWLSGLHLSSTEPRKTNVHQESIKDSSLFESVRDSPETKKALRDLSKSKNAWVREYAELAGRGIRERRQSEK